MPRLTRRMVRAWLDRDDAERLERIAAGRGVDLPTLITDTLSPLLDAEGQGVQVFTVALEHEDVRRLRAIVERHCSEEPDPVDIDAELPKWLQTYCVIGIDNDAGSKFRTCI